MKHIKLYEQLDEVTSQEIWKAVSKAQLDKYKEEGPKDLTLGDIDYEIKDYFMDEHDVPTLEIVAKKSRSVHTVYLSMVWSGYENWSALDSKGREELRKKYFL